LDFCRQSDRRFSRVWVFLRFSDAVRVVNIESIDSRHEMANGRRSQTPLKSFPPVGLQARLPIEGPQVERAVTTALPSAHELGEARNFMESSHGDTQVVSVEDLELIPGRHSIHCEPDFCGRMNIVLDERSPDRVTFSCDTSLVEGADYTISVGNAEAIRVRISRSNGSRYTATVVDAREMTS
jgi:hypothetical protein